MIREFLYNFITILLVYITMTPQCIVGMEYANGRILFSDAHTTSAESITTQSCIETEEELLNGLFSSDEILSTLLHATKTAFDVPCLRASKSLKRELYTGSFLKKAMQLFRIEILYTVTFREQVKNHFLIEVSGPALQEKYAPILGATTKRPSFFSEIRHLAQAQPDEFNNFLARAKNNAEMLAESCAERIRAKNCAFILYIQELIANNKVLTFKFNVAKFLKNSSDATHTICKLQTESSLETY